MFLVSNLLQTTRKILSFEYTDLFNFYAVCQSNDTIKDEGTSPMTYHQHLLATYLNIWVYNGHSNGVVHNNWKKIDLLVLAVL